MKQSEWASTRARAPAATSPVSRSTDMPVMKERYDGNSGSTQGDRNEKSPAENATSTPSDSLMPASLQQRLEERAPVLAVPLARAVGEEHPLAVAVDDEGRRYRPHPVGLADRHLGIESHREREVVLFDERIHHARPLRVEGDRQDHEPAVLVGAVQPLHARHLLAARIAPGGPEVQEDDLALEVGQLDGAIVGSAELEILRVLDRLGTNQRERRDRILGECEAG